MGLQINVFVLVRLAKQTEPALKLFETAINGRPEIMECSIITGIADYLLRVVVSDLDAYEVFVTEFVAKIPCVETIQSSFALKQVKYKTVLPLDVPADAPREVGTGQAYTPGEEQGGGAQAPGVGEPTGRHRPQDSRGPSEECANLQRGTGPGCRIIRLAVSGARQVA